MCVADDERSKVHGEREIGDVRRAVAAVGSGGIGP